MALKEIKCPDCGHRRYVNDSQKDFTCPYCGGTLQFTEPKAEPKKDISAGAPFSYSPPPEFNSTPPSASSGARYTPPPSQPSNGYTPPPASSGARYTPPPSQPSNGYTPPPASSNGYTPPPVSSGARYTPPPASSGARYTPPPPQPTSSYIPPPNSVGARYTPPPSSTGTRYTPPPYKTDTYTPSSQAPAQNYSVNTNTTNKKRRVEPAPIIILIVFFTVVIWIIAAFTADNCAGDSGPWYNDPNLQTDAVNSAKQAVENNALYPNSYTVTEWNEAVYIEHNYGIYITFIDVSCTKNGTDYRYYFYVCIRFTESNQKNGGYSHWHYMRTDSIDNFEKLEELKVANDFYDVPDKYR